MSALAGTETEAVALATLREALLSSSALHGTAALEHLALAGPPRTAAYAEHRALAFVHQWCHLLERPPADSEPLRELIGNPVTLRLSNGNELTTFSEVAAWHDATAHAMDVTSHTLIGWKLTVLEDGRYDVVIDFAWQGISPKAQAMVARTHHEWSLDDTDERFPRLASFAATLVRPFAPASAVDALADLRAVTSR